jgi:succinate dehydrogenase / fumarate reductase membrane anchor subunit
MSGKHGTGHFIGERVSAIALLFLLPWFVISAASTLHLGFDQARAWIRDPINAIGLALLIAIGAYHTQLGLRVIIDDYIGRPMTHGILSLLNLAGAAVLAGFGLWAVFVNSTGG